MTHRKTKTAYKKERANIDKNVIRIASRPYQDWFPLARSIRRRFVLHVGPTNSGKTHDAIEDMMKADNGVYLAPLRLLALEIGEDLNDAGIACNVITGEEKHTVDGATHDSSTIEMLNFSRHYDVAVIDEAQMIGDEYRGGAWSSAIMGVYADVVNVCISPVALNIVIDLIKLCGDDYEIVRHDRKTPLVVEDYPYNPAIMKPQKGDAFIAFSKRDVLQIACKLQRKGNKVSVVYGALPWKVRRREAEKFRNGETDIVVATDAIGMGLNLPVRRIIFTSIRKYDGREVRTLTKEEVRQIAGRAGRYGIYDEGLVTTYSPNDLKVIAGIIGKKIKNDVRIAMLEPPAELLMDETYKLSTLLAAWNRISIDKLIKSDDDNVYNDSNLFMKESTDNQMAAVQWLENYLRGSYNEGYVSREELLAMSTVQFDYDKYEQQALWARMCSAYIENKGSLSKQPMTVIEPDANFSMDERNLDYYANIAHELNIKYSFARSMGLIDKNLDRKFQQVRATVENRMIEILADGVPDQFSDYYDDYYYDEDEDEDDYNDYPWNNGNRRW